MDLDFANGFFEKGCQLKRFFFGTFQPSSMRPRDTVEMQGFELVAIFVATSDLQNIFQGPLRAPKEPSGMENWSRDPWVTASPPSRQIVSIFTRDSGRKCLGHCKYAAILAVEFHPVKMQAIWPAALVGAPSGHHRTTSKQKTAFQKSLSTSKAFFLDFSALADVVTRHRKYAANLLGEPLRSNLCFSNFWQKCARVLFCTFRRGRGTP